MEQPMASAPPAAWPHPPPADPAAERQWAVFAHVAALAGLIVPFGNIVGPLIVWVLGREKGPFAAHHARESLNFQVTVAIAVLVLGAVAFTSLLLGFLILPLALMVLAFVVMGIVVIAAVILVILASVEANRGAWYRYPFAYRFVT